MAVNETYKPLQDLRNTDINKWHATIDQEQAKNAANLDRHIAYTNEQMNQKYEDANIDQAGQYHNPTRGWSSDDPNYQSTVDRTVKEGISGADEYWLNDSELAYVQYCKQKYEEAKVAGDREMMNYWHTEAEKTRARQGYSGGSDGSMYIDTMQRPVQTADVDVGGMGTSTGGAPAGGASDLKSLLDAWQKAALQQNSGQVDYAVAEAVADLERALADAQPQFKEQAESVDRDARQAMDNSALYAELRGDKGGIGQEQYNAIQNTQAQNHLAVQQAQTKLATDTQRQIADLRAQGEFEKADAALEITQNYLAQLVSLEQWAAEYNLSVEQFNESVRQWEASYNMEMQKLQTSQNQWQAEFDYAKQLNSQNQLAGMGEALLSAGIPLTDEQLKAMGITGEQASQLLIQAQLAAAQGSGGGTPAVSLANVDLDSAYDYLYSKKLTSDSSKEAIVSMLIANGIPEDVAKQIAPLYKDLGYAQAEERYNNNNPLEATAPSVGMNPDYFEKEMMVLVNYLGHGKLDNLESRVNYLWPLLSEEQRKQLETTLGKYGIALG